MTKHSDGMPNPDLMLSHHEKRTLAWKVLIVTFIFIAVMMFGGMLHFLLGISDVLLGIWMAAVSFVGIGMFGIGYLIRDKLPTRMNLRCKRFYYMGQEFGIWHWTRAQIFLADIFLVALGGAVFGWGFAHTLPSLLSGASLTTIVPGLYIPIMYCELWIELSIEIFFLAVSVFGFIYEARTWILSKRNDFCYFEGINSRSAGMTYECDPDDLDCNLNSNVR